MNAADSAARGDWLGLCRRAAQGIARMLRDTPTTGERARETGRGEGGDEAVYIDRAAEEIVFALLDEVHAAGERFCAISEERGVVDYGSSDLRVVIDPIDGSMNAKRGLPHHALSVAVAEGGTMADVAFGFVHDFGAGEEWAAVRGDGATLDGRPLPQSPDERRTPDGRLELVAIESADPRHMAAASAGMLASINRVRALGTIAVAMCQVAATRVDGMVTLWRCRAVDAAAAQLIVRESGGLVAFPAFEDPLGAPLDLVPHSPVVAARTARALAELAAVSAAG